MAGYSVDVEALGDLQERMARYLALCADNLTRVQQLIGAVSASWDGTASNAYQQRHNQWIAALKDMNESLQEFKSWSADSEEAYRAVMAMNLRMAGG